MSPSRALPRVVFGSVCALLACLPSITWAGAWTQPPGRVYLRTTFGWLESRVRYDEEGNRVGLESSEPTRRGTEYRDWGIRLYGEYGLVEDLTVFGTIAHKHVRILEPATAPPRALEEEVRTTAGFGDVSLGVRRSVVRGRVPVSIAAEAKVPGGYSASASPTLGSGQTDATLRAMIGASSAGAYATADVGWTLRSGDFQDELQYSAEVGGRFLDRFYSWRGVLRGRVALGSTSRPATDEVFDPGLSSPRILEVSGVLGAAIARNVDLEFGMTHAISGRNTLAGTSFEAGFAWAWGGKR